MAHTISTDRGTADRGLDETRKAQLRDQIQANVIGNNADPTYFMRVLDVRYLIKEARKIQAIFLGPETGPASRAAAAKALIGFCDFLRTMEKRSVPGNGRDAEGGLVFKSDFEGLLPWDDTRPKTLEDLYPFANANLQQWRNEGLLRRIGGAGVAMRNPQPAAGKAVHGTVEEEGQLMHIDHIRIPPVRIIKTDDMSFSTDTGRKYIMIAVIKQLHPRLSEDRIVLLIQNLSAITLPNWHDQPGEDSFRYLRSGAGFYLQYDQAFLDDLQQLEKVPDQVLYDRAEQRIRRARQLWVPLMEDRTLLERMLYVVNRIAYAKSEYNFRDIPYIPGKMYSSNLLFVDYAGTPDDQLWLAPDGRLLQVNERNLRLEAFRQGVMTARNIPIAMGYIAIAVTAAVLAAPLIAASTLPVAAQSLYLTMASQPLTFLATAEFGLNTAIQIDEAGGFDNFIESLHQPSTAIQFLLNALGVFQGVVGDRDLAKAGAGSVQDAEPADVPKAAAGSKPLNQQPEQTNAANANAAASQSAARQPVTPEAPADFVNGNRGTADNGHNMPGKTSRSSQGPRLEDEPAWQIREKKVGKGNASALPDKEKGSPNPDTAPPDPTLVTGKKGGAAPKPAEPVKKDRTTGSANRGLPTEPSDEVGPQARKKTAPATNAAEAESEKKDRATGRANRGLPDDPPEEEGKPAGKGKKAKPNAKKSGKETAGAGKTGVPSFAPRKRWTKEDIEEAMKYGVPFEEWTEDEVSAYNAYWAALKAEGGDPGKAGTAFHDRMGAASHGADIETKPSQTEIKTTLATDPAKIADVANRASPQSIGYAEAYQATPLEGIHYVKLRAVVIYLINPARYPVKIRLH